MTSPASPSPRYLQNRTPSPWVVRFAPLVRAGGAVLDVAAGGGRHARHFLSRGHPVTALDRAVAALEDLDGAEVVQADLEDGTPWPLAGRRFAAVVVVNYLHRPLLGALLAALEPGGVLIYESFAAGNETFRRVRDTGHLLHAGELLDWAAGRLQVVAYEHGIEARQPQPCVVQRLCAVNDLDPSARADGQPLPHPLAGGDCG